MTLAYIPSPTTAVWNLGPVPIRAYALFIIAGIIIACIVTEIRLRARGAPEYAVLDLVVWAVPFGVVGGRLYHVITTPDRYFGADGNLADAVRIWDGGLGIWGAIAGGALGVWFACRRLRLPFVMVADAAAVGIPLAQAVGRLGNWFNNELYGSETTLPWGLQVHRMVDGRAVPDPATGEITFAGTYHPTFLYEMLWNIGVAILVWQVGKRLQLGGGRQFALYVMAYTAGRFWIEMLRIDGTVLAPSELRDSVIEVAGQRINVWVSALVFLAALGYFLWARGRPAEYLIPASATTPADDGGEDDGADEPAPGDRGGARMTAGYRVVAQAEYRAYRAREAASAPEPAGGADPAGAADAADAANLADAEDLADAAGKAAAAGEVDDPAPRTGSADPAAAPSGAPHDDDA